MYLIHWDFLWKWDSCWDECTTLLMRSKISLVMNTCIIHSFKYEDNELMNVGHSMTPEFATQMNIYQKKIIQWMYSLRSGCAQWIILSMITAKINSFEDKSIQHMRLLSRQWMQFMQTRKITRKIAILYVYIPLLSSLINRIMWRWPMKKTRAKENNYDRRPTFYWIHHRVNRFVFGKHCTQCEKRMFRPSDFIRLLNIANPTRRISAYTTDHVSIEFCDLLHDAIPFLVSCN